MRIIYGAVDTNSHGQLIPPYDETGQRIFSIIHWNRVVNSLIDMNGSVLIAWFLINFATWGIKLGIIVYGDRAICKHTPGMQIVDTNESRSCFRVSCPREVKVWTYFCYTKQLIRWHWNFDTIHHDRSTCRKSNHSRMPEYLCWYVERHHLMKSI